MVLFHLRQFGPEVMLNPMAVAFGMAPPLWTRWTSKADHRLRPIRFLSGTLLLRTHRVSAWLDPASP
jgi:hypothetical protein